MKRWFASWSIVFHDWLLVRLLGRETAAAAQWSRGLGIKVGLALSASPTGAVYVEVDADRNVTVNTVIHTVITRESENT